MNLYAESSAVLAWLFVEAAEPDICAVIADAETVVSSELTLIECDRAIWRSAAMGITSETKAGELKGLVARLADYWTILPITTPIIARACQPFPQEPIRTLDALHVASALHARLAFSDLTMLSLDERVRQVAGTLGLPLLPS